MSQDHRPNCHQCGYFHTTWDRKFPNGCHKFGFKTKQLPSLEVLATTGRQCPFWIEKSDQPPEPESPRDGSTFSSLG